MVHREQLEARFREQPNPFSDRVLRNGFDEPPEDVPDIHGDKRLALRALVERVRADGRPRMQVVTGEAGDGKTHLLATLRAASEASWRLRGQEHVLVPIEPLREKEAPFQHLLRSLVAGLSRPLPWVTPDAAAPASPLEHLLWRGFAQLVTDVRAPPDAEVARLLAPLRQPTAQKGPARFAELLREAWPLLKASVEQLGLRVPRLAPPAVDAETWRLLMRFPEEGADRLVVRWLSGELLGEDELFLLGARAPVDGEERAYRVLTTLLHFADVPIVLGLDQLEGVRRLGDDAVPGLLGALTSLYSAGGRWVALLFCQQTVWSELARGLEEQVLDRLEPAVLHLTRTTPELGEKLVARRLSGLVRGLGLTPPHATYPFPEGYVREAIRSENLSSPRGVLAYFSRIGVTLSPPALASGPGVPEPSPRDPRRMAREAYSRALAQLEADPTTTPEQRATNAAAAVRSILHAADGRELSGTRVSDVHRAPVRKGVTREGLHATVERAGHARRLYVEASNAQNGMSAASTARRLVDALANVDRALWLREAGFALPPAARAEVERAAGRVRLAEVSRQEALSLAAAEKLLDAVAAREVDISDEEARDALLIELAPKLQGLSRLLAAAFDDTERAHPDRSLPARLEAQLEVPPSVMTEAALAERLGTTRDAVAQAATALEAQRKVAVLKDRDGARLLVRRPRA